MDQYCPAWKAKTEAKFSDINREIRESEFERALLRTTGRLVAVGQALAPRAAQVRVRRDSPGGLKLAGRLIKQMIDARSFIPENHQIIVPQKCHGSGNK
jgi:hypothetical protein